MGKKTLQKIGITRAVLGGIAAVLAIAIGLTGPMKAHAQGELPPAAPAGNAPNQTQDQGNAQGTAPTAQNNQNSGALSPPQGPSGTLAPPAGMARPQSAQGQNQGQAQGQAQGQGQGQAGQPGMNLPVGQQLARERKSKEELEAELRDEAFDAAVSGILPLKPDEIHRFLEEYDKTREAVQTPFYKRPKPKVDLMTISLDPGQVPPVIHMAVGYVTTINVVDITGSPWPIEDVGWAGEFEIAQPGPGSHIVRITPMEHYAFGNMSIRLVGLDTPVTVTLDTGRDNVQYRLDLRVPDYGPNAKPPTVEGGVSAEAGSKTLTTILQGVPPGKAKKLKVSGVDGRTSAYVVGDKTYVRTPLTLLSPGWDSSVRSADGMNVYALGDAPVLLLSDSGRMVRAHVKSTGEDE